MNFFPPRVNPLVLSLGVLALMLTLSSADGFAQTPAVPIASSDRQRGIDLYRKGETKAAIEVLNRVTKQSKEDGEAWYYLGLALSRNNQHDKARKAFETSTKLQPDFGPGHTGYSYALLLTGKTEAAGNEARRAIELDDRLAEAHYVLGVVHLRAGNLQQAELESSSATKLKPDFPAAYLLKYQALLGLYARQVVSTAHPETDASEEQLEKWRKETRELIKQAKAALETFINQSPSPADIWRDQLATMRLHVEGSSDVLRLPAVTTKARVRSKPEPSYTEEARNAGVEGTVVLRAVFASDGKVKHILVLASLPYGLTEAAVEAARKIRFVPATKDGRPVSMWMQLEYNFNLY